MRLVEELMATVGCWSRREPRLRRRRRGWQWLFLSLIHGGTKRGAIGHQVAGEGVDLLVVVFGRCKR